MNWDGSLTWYQSLDDKAVTSSNLTILIYIYLIKIKYKVIWTCANFKLKKLLYILKNNINYLLKPYIILHNSWHLPGLQHSIRSSYFVRFSDNIRSKKMSAETLDAQDTFSWQEKMLKWFNQGKYETQQALVQHKNSMFWTFGTSPVLNSSKIRPDLRTYH